MSDSVGLSGFLAPDGIFYPCEYQEHRELAQELEEKYKLDHGTSRDYNMFADFFYFAYTQGASKKGSLGCCAFFNLANTQIKPTEEQLKWLEENWSKMTLRQSTMTLDAMDFYDIEDRFKEKHNQLKQLVEV